MKPRRSNGLLDRAIQQRDARVFVLALEGERTGEEYRYFEALERLDGFDRRRVKLEVLPTPDKNSAPNHVLERLRQFEQNQPIRELDQLWLVIDRDTWKDRMLSEVCQAAYRSEFHVALSNSCFELWLILHASDDLSFLEGVETSVRASACKRQLSKLRLAGATGPNLAALWRARHAAAALDLDRGDRWPRHPGTHVYRLIDALAEAGALPR